MEAKRKEMDTKKELLDNIVDAVRQAGEIILGAESIEDFVEEKSGHANFVTAYDKKVQDFLFGKLKEILPEAVFIGEEEETHAALPEGYAFIIDPIDGTTNFMKGYCASCISVGLLKKGKAEIGVVYNPYLKEMFHAIKGEGAFATESRFMYPREVFRTDLFYSEVHLIMKSLRRNHLNGRTVCL